MLSWCLNMILIKVGKMVMNVKNSVFVNVIFESIFVIKFIVGLSGLISGMNFLLFFKLLVILIGLNIIVV